MTRKTRFAALAASAALATSLAACGGDDNGGDAGAFCDKAEELDQTDMAQLDPMDEDATNTLAAAFDELRDAAPGEIRGDFDTLSDTLNMFADIDFTDPAAFEELEQLDEAELEAASDRIEDYLSSECGIS